MLLSETREGLTWLEQFKSEPYAKAYMKLFLDKLTLVSKTSFEQELECFIIDEAKKEKRPIALVPIIEMDKSQRQSYFNQPKKDKNKQYRNSEITQILPKKSYPGSEAVIAHLCDKLQKLHPKLFTNAPDIKTLRESKCKTIFFIDDSVGSGDRVKNFINAFKKHVSIKSWLSYGWINYYVVCYSATEFGQNVLNNCFKSKNFYGIKKILPEYPTLKNIFMEKDKKIIEDILKKYSEEDSEEDSFGYKGVGGMLLFEHSIPNNSPNILWSGKNALFSSRRVENSLNFVFNNKEIEPSFNSIFSNKTIKYYKFFLVLDCIYQKKEITTLTPYIPYNEASKIKNLLKTQEYINLDGSISELGTLILKHKIRKYEIKKAFEQTKAESENKFYFPSSLRKVF